MPYETMAAAPVFTAKESRLVSGLRWTLWLSVLTAPCGYVTSILLARIGPEAIGEYGLLSLYTSITSVFLFLGGPAVAIRFLPRLAPEQRGAFFWSYLAVACAAALPFQAAAFFWPRGLHYLFGDAGTPRFHLLLICLADLYVLFNLAIAGLKAVLELKPAQLLLRSVTVGSFAVYVSLYLFVPRLMAERYHAVIWCTYFGITAVVTGMALRRLFVLFPRPVGKWRLILPEGFWRYTLGLQASSTLGFVSTKLDYLLILNAGGLAMLGHYVALMTLVSLVPLFATFVLDSYLPSLTTLLSAGDLNGAERLTRTYIRLIVLSGAGAISFMSLFAGPLVQMLGPHYTELTVVLRMALPFAGVQIGNWIIGTIFSGIGRPQRDAVAKAVRTVLFVVVFWPLWNAAQFTGVVGAWGIAETTYQVMSLYFLRGTGRLHVPLYGAYVPMLIVAVALQYLAGRIGSYGLPAAAAAWVMAMAAFLISARYSVDELISLWRAVIPGAADAEIFAGKTGASSVT